MKILQPYYYDDFKCIAGECRDSCCIGWHVFIDKKNFFEYKKVSGEFGKELNKKIKRRRNKENDNEYGEMVLHSEGRCSLLNNENLCDLYINKGEKYLCRTCKTYPRLISKYTENMLERNLMLSCPAVAEILVKMSSPFEFIMKDEVLTDIDVLGKVEWSGFSEQYNSFIKSRDLFIDLAQFSQIPLWKRLIFIQIAKERIKNQVKARDYKNIDYKIKVIKEYVTDSNNINQLDDIVEKRTNEKFNILLDIISKIYENREFPNKTFDKILKYLIDFAERDEETESFIEKKEIEFNEYFKERELILENYIVWNLYANYMDAMEDSNIDKPIHYLIISHSIIKLLLLAVWYSNEYKLSDDDIVDVLYSYTKIVSTSQVENICKFIKDKGYDTTFYLSMIIY